VTRTGPKVIVGVDPDAANREAISTWCKEYFDALHPFSAGGTYVNFMMDEGQQRVQASSRDNYPAPRAHQEAIRPGQSLSREPEHSPWSVTCR
jgi:hypothetical protein